MRDAQLYFIAGPTASGKSAAALALGTQTGGVIVNADAMQVYQGLRIITARPSEADEARVPHRLYGVLEPSERCSAGRWARMAADEIAAIHASGKPAIVVGGTGLYFKALLEGLSPIPDTPPAVREAARARRETLGAAAFRDEVIARDPGMTHLPEGDAQRLMRAWEVVEASGKTLTYFQSLPRTPLVSVDPQKTILAPPREKLYAQCDQRAEAMFAQGGVEEVEALLARRLDPQLPAMKTLGVPEIAAYLNGAMSREEALSALQQNTRRLAKRQMTWLRHQMEGWSVREEGLGFGD
jgi:tRNA dimethylallyltransferase